MSRNVSRRVFQKTLFSVACVLAMGGTHAAAQAADGKLDVVASFSILADMVATVGGDSVDVSVIVGRDADAHGFEPTPRDARKLAGADLLFVNGLEFEAWLPRLVEASGFKGKQIVVSQGVKPLAFDGHGHDDDGGHDHGHEHEHGHAEGSSPDHHAHEASHEHEHEHGHDHEHAHGHGQESHGHAQDEGKTHEAAHAHEHSHAHGSEDPHAWQDPANAVIYVQNIAQGLAEADPANAAGYRSRAEAYIGEIRQLDAEIRQALKAVPEADRTVVTSHEAFGYFSKAYGIRFLSAVGVSSQAEASARDVASLIDQVRKENIKAVFVENITNPRLVEQIARETGARMGGTLYSDALAPAGQPAGTYLGMLRWNADQVLKALKGG